MKYNEIPEKTIQNDNSLKEQLKAFDMSGKTIKSILSSYSGDPHINIFADGYDCSFIYYDKILIQFEDEDVFEIQGYDGEQYDNVFFLSVNNYIKQFDAVKNTMQDIVFGPSCYGRKVDGFIFESKSTNRDYSGRHNFGIKLENNIIIWFQQAFDETFVFLEDIDGNIIKGTYYNYHLAFIDKAPAFEIEDLAQYNGYELWKFSTNDFYITAIHQDERVRIFINEEFKLSNKLITRTDNYEVENLNCSRAWESLWEFRYWNNSMKDKPYDSNQE